MNEIKDINKIIEDYPFNEGNPFLTETPSEEKIYTREDFVNDEDYDPTARTQRISTQDVDRMQKNSRKKVWIFDWDFSKYLL